eukprot:XP_011671476.1 PREDICTED: methyltransferase-like protein 25 [Strongylocentrotus purpuratus]
MEDVRMHLDNILQFISKFMSVLECSTVNFYTNNMWDDNLDCEFASQLLQLTDTELALFPSGRVLLHSQSKSLDGQVPLLRKFMKEMVENRLDTLALPIDSVTECCGKEYLRATAGQDVEHDTRSSGEEQMEEPLDAAVSQEREWRENAELTKRIMGNKKSHEVALMAQKCANLLSATGIKQVIDIGSGKGYLGQFLTMQYGINVISVDSSETNTNGALKRNNRLSKQWRGIVKNATQRRQEKVSDAGSACSMKYCRLESRSNSGSEKTRNNDGTAADRIASEKTVDVKGLFYRAVLQPFMMVGLHTCGDLAPSMLRIFQSNPSMHCLCNVGCCYHHVTEEFAKKDEWDREHSGIKMGSSFGFPMSDYLREKKVALGRGARMTACMAADRIASEKTVDVKGLFYRAVLQVICRDHFTIPTRKQIIGKLAPKCKSFMEYARKALKKLKMDDTKISDDEISAYEAEYRPFYRHLAAYNQLRAALSPSIEAIILLDRLLYLKEQPNIKTACIVRLFDPVTSPRCYGIFAVKATDCL